MRGRLFLLLLLGLAACGPDEYRCTSFEFCSFDGITGLCLSDKMGRFYCARRYEGCPTGYRWDALASPELRWRCVRPEYLPMDGGTIGDTAPPPTD